MAKDGSKNSQADGNENQFEKTLSHQVDIPLSRTPLNAIPDPSQFSKEFFQEVLIHNGFRDKSLEAGSTSNRRKYDSAHSTPARRTTYGGQLGACTGPRALQSTGERAGSSSRVSRRISNVNCEPTPTEVPHFELVEDPSFWNDHNVQVLIRMRPLSNMEKMAQGFGRCLKQESLQTLVWLGHPEVRFTFDHIVCETISQEKLFSVAGLPMVDNCMSGYNSCMFAYGQTGSGKTYTMMGEISQQDGKLVDDCGITPRLFEYLFMRIKLEEENRRDERLEYSCKCSFLEIYNEQIIDLLEPSSTNLQLREDLKEGVYVENLTEYNVKTVDEVLKLLLQGAANRKVAGTDMNSESSRSHGVFTCIVESRWEKDSMTHLRFARLNLVDLAGSERQRSSGAGERLKEASYINKSLSTLGLVIMSLVDVAHGKHRHVPYRDSRLTFLLQDSLGGNSKTTIIANVSPSMCAANETLSTLKFAQRAKLIQNDAKVNEDASGDVTALQQQIQMLKEQMSLLMKHQKISKPLFQVGPTLQPSLGGFFEREDPSGENICDASNVLNDQKRKIKNFETTLLGDSSGEKLAGTGFRAIHSPSKQKNRPALPREDVQCTKMLLRFREKKIKRLELLANGIISTDSYLMDENNALVEEIQQLQARIDRNPEVTSFQDCYERNEREALLAEVLALHDQLLKTLEVEESYIEQHFPSEREYEDDKSAMELEEYKCANSKLIRKVDELKRELGKYMTCSQTAVYPVTMLSIDLRDEMEASDQVEDGVQLDNRGLKRTNRSHTTNIVEELMDARTLLDAMESQQVRLVEELQYVRQENDRLVETLSNSNKAQTCPMLDHESHISENGWLLSQNLPSVNDDSTDGMMDLQARLDKMANELEDVGFLNDHDDHLSHSSLRDQVDLIHEEVENEATNAILHLQEELASLQVKYHRRLCSMSEENKKLRRIVAAKEDEVYKLHTDWERASLELTSFLLDGSKSLKDASGQIESIARSFPCYNVWVGEHVKKAATVCIEKEQTVLQLEKNLVDAQSTIVEMQEKLSSLRSATIALTEIQYTEHDARIEEAYPLSSKLDDKTNMTDFQDNKFMSKEYQICKVVDNAKTTLLEAKGQYDQNKTFQTDMVQTDVVRSNFGTSTIESKNGSGMNIYANSSKLMEIEDQLEVARQGLEKTKIALNMSSIDAEMCLSTFQAKVYNAFSLYKDLVNDFMKGICEMRKNLVEFKETNKMAEVPRVETPLEEACTHQMQEEHLLVLHQIIAELVSINNRLDNVKAYLSSIHDQVISEDLEGCATDISTSSSILSDDEDVLENIFVEHCCEVSSGATEQTSAIVSEGGSKYSSIYQDSEKQGRDVISLSAGSEAHLFLKKQFIMAHEAFIKLDVQLAAVFKDKEYGYHSKAGLGFMQSLGCMKLDEKEISKDVFNELQNPEMSARRPSDLEMQEEAASCFIARKFVAEEKGCKASSFFSKFEETCATVDEADNMLNALLKANEEAKMLTGRWKQAAEEVMVEKASLIEEIKQLKFDLHLRDEEHAVLEEESRCSLVELANSVSMLEGSFGHLKREAEDLCHLIYADALAMVQDIHQNMCKSRSSLQDICAETMERTFACLVIQQCHIGEYINKFQLAANYGLWPSRLQEEIMEHVETLRFGQNLLISNAVNGGEEENYSALAARKETGELGASSDDLIDENLKLKKELERKSTLLNGLLFDFSLLQESASTRKDIKDEAEKLFTALSQVQHELKMKTNQLDGMLVGYEKLECCLADTEAALSASKSCLQHAEETVDALSYQNAELRSLLEDLYLKKSETEKQLEEQKEIVMSLEKEIHCTTCSAQEQFLFSLEGITDDLKRVSSERDQLCEQVISLQGRLEMAYAIADENEAVAVEARQESETSKIYVEQKEEEVKILEHSVEELDCTINVLEKRVKEMEEELERHHSIRDSLELELQSLNQRLLTVENFRYSRHSDDYSVGQSEDQISRELHNRCRELQEAHVRIKDLEDERAEQANEIKQCKEYISELVIHAEAQASQYQQKYKSLEAMVSVMKIDSSKSGSEVPSSDKTEKSSVRARGSNSPFRCIGNLVQQMNTEKDQELSLAKLRLEEQEALASSRQKEICMLNTKLAAAESMTHDVIRDLLGVKLDMTKYANLINQKQLQRFIEDAAQQTQEFIAMEQEIRKLKREINDLYEERERCISEIHSQEADMLAIKMSVGQLKGREQLVTAQNQMLKAEKSNLQRRVAELDELMKKVLGTQPSSTSSQEWRGEFGMRVANSQKLLQRVNNELAQYRKPDGRGRHPT